MSKIEYCPKGGMEGIRVSDEELNSFTDAIGSKALDEFIPLPHLTIPQQQAMISVCNHQDGDSDEESEYWENKDSGGHGWCCTKCGKVTQWG